MGKNILKSFKAVLLVGLLSLSFGAFSEDEVTPDGYGATDPSCDDLVASQTEGAGVVVDPEAITTEGNTSDR